MIDIYYRGLLDSCNYDCSYCPFSKNQIDKKNIEKDKHATQQFIEWIEHLNEDAHLMITPWGEAATYSYYQDALIKLSKMPNIKTAAIQTNLSGSLDWVKNANTKTLALWTTWHPEQVSYDSFYTRLKTLSDFGIRYSVGIVALPKYLEEAKKLRDNLPPNVYLWLNAAKEQEIVYDKPLIDIIHAIDPLFELNLADYRSLNVSCQTGRTSILVDGYGNVQRCHAVKSFMGNIYKNDIDEILYKGDHPCINTVCDCYVCQIHFKPELFKKHFIGNVIWRGKC